jgi:transcriptional regulator with XRE-family HTH domain
VNQPLDYMSVGERIAIYRRRRGLSQLSLANMIGRSEAWLSQVERGVRHVDRLSVLIRLAQVLKVTVEDLIGQPLSLAPNGGIEFRAIRLHDLRHTHATLALQAGVHPKVISERLGHATVAITLDIYSHAIPALQQDAAVIVADLVTGVTPAGQG